MMHLHVYSNTTLNEKLLHQSSSRPKQSYGFEIEETLQVLQNPHTRQESVYLNLKLLLKLSLSSSPFYVGSTILQLNNTATIKGKRK